MGIFPFNRKYTSLKVYLHVPSPCPCSSPSPSKFTIIPIVMDYLSDRLGMGPIQSVNVNITVKETGTETVRANGP